MKEIFKVAILFVIFSFCFIPKSNSNQIEWGKIEGKKVYLFTLKNKNGSSVEISNYGGIMTKWICKDKNNTFNSVILGFDSLKTYIQNPSYFGASIGRFGNRIAKGKFNLNGVTYQLAKNNGNNFLHGGLKSFDKVVWDFEFNTMKPNSITLTYLSKDMEEGFPGNLSVKVKYTLTDSEELKIEYWAETDKITIVNLTQHNYYNLTGNPLKSILEHRLSIVGNKYLPVDNELIPTGVIKSTENSPFDFTKPIKIGTHIQKVKGGFDHNWVLNASKDGKMALAAILMDSVSGRKMEIFTTEPGLQFYSGNFLDGSIKTEKGVALEKYSGLCLETQHFPDSPNRPNFPSTILKPNQVFKSITIYKISVMK